jgi:hypothetical protein
MKRCSSCHRLKPLDDFHRNAHHKDGHSYDCKRCRSIDYWNQPVEEKRRKRALRIQRGYQIGVARERSECEKKRCATCRQILPVAVFGPDRVEPDGGSECAECAGAVPWFPRILLRARRGLLAHLSVYDEDLPIAAGLSG